VPKLAACQTPSVSVDRVIPSSQSKTHVSPVRMLAPMELHWQLPLLPKGGGSTSSIMQSSPASENIHESAHPSATMYESPATVVVV